MTIRSFRSLSGSGARRLLLLAVFALFAWNLWGYDLWAPDEPFFGEGAREMIADGKWLVPHVNGEVNNHKPPLFFWLIALLSLPFGEVSSVTARLPSTIAALVTVWATMYMARRAATERAGLLAGAVLATSFLFWNKARMAQIDSLLCCLITLALLAFVEFRAGRLSGRVAGVAFWSACALAVLAKGPVGLALPLGTALLVLASERSLAAWRRFAPVAGPLAFVAIAGAWVAALELWPVAGYSVVGSLREHFVERGLSGMHHLQPWWYYAEVLPWALFPWSLLVPGAIVYAWPRRGREIVRLALVHAGFVVLFFSLSAEKRGLYILPALPAVAILVALFLDSRLARAAPVDAAESRLSRRWLLAPQAVVGAILVLAGLLLPFLALREFPELLATGVALAVVFVVGGALIAHSAWRARPDRVVLSTCLAMAAAFLTATTVGYPALDRQKSGRALAGEVAAAVATLPAPKPRVVALEISNLIRPINFYSGGIYARQIDDGQTDVLLELLAEGTPFVLVADRSVLPEISPVEEARLVELYATRLSRRDIVVYRVDGR